MTVFVGSRVVRRISHASGGVAFPGHILNTRQMSDAVVSPRHVLHMAPQDRWSQAAAKPEGDYIDESLSAEGFIHCSTADQVLIPANDRFAGRDDLVLLVIDLERVPSRTVFEDCYESGNAFPHIYGPIPVAAVTRVVPFPCEPDGRFQLPEMLSSASNQEFI